MAAVKSLNFTSVSAQFKGGGGEHKHKSAAKQRHKVQTEVKGQFAHCWRFLLHFSVSAMDCSITPCRPVEASSELFPQAESCFL